MINFTNVTTIDRPSNEVYAYLSDLEHTPEWNWAISETRKATPGPIAVGSRYQQTRTVPEPATEDLEITGLSQDQWIEIAGTLARFPARLSYRLSERGGATEVTNTVSLDVRGALGLIAPIVAPRIKRAVADNLDDLKQRLEAGG